MFPSKDKIKIPESSFTQVGSVLTHKHKTRLKGLQGKNTLNTLLTFLNYNLKKLNKIGPGVNPIKNVLQT